VVGGEAVFQAVRPAGVLGDVARDRAHLLRRRIRCVEVAQRPHRFADLEIGHPRLHGDLVVFEVDGEDRSHPAEADDHAIGNREGSAGQSRAGAACDERHPCLGACPDGLGHLRGGERQHDRGRRDAPPGEAVACVGLQCRRRGDHSLVADDLAQPLGRARSSMGARHRRRGIHRACRCRPGDHEQRHRCHEPYTCCHKAGAAVRAGTTGRAGGRDVPSLPRCAGYRRVDFAVVLDGVATEGGDDDRRVLAN